MLENGKIMTSMEMELIRMPMEISILENGKKLNITAKEFTHIQMEQ